MGPLHGRDLDRAARRIPGPDHGSRAHCRAKARLFQLPAAVCPDDVRAVAEGVSGCPVAPLKQDQAIKDRLLELLRCPTCKGSLTASVQDRADGEIASGLLCCGTCRKEYPVVQFVPRFVSSDNYASSFGFQWNLFGRTQLDSHT
ncbi:MAG: Trm112 family protein, partial [Acidobacteria bacterium]|nr:Trm112 family protein [Acidobacteriota bacterium]